MIGTSIASKIERAVPPLGTVIDLDGERIHYVDRGSGAPIVLIHGLAGNLRNYTYALVDRLANDFRVIALDRPGSGYSPRSHKTSASLAAQSATIARLIHALGLERPLVVGHSLGGAVSLALALNHPESAGALALLAPLTQVREKVPNAFRGLDIHSPLLRAIVAHTVAAPIAMKTGPDVVRAIFKPEAVPDDFATRGGGLLGMRPEGFYASSSDMIEVHRGMTDLVARYPHLNLPIGILFGTDDAILDYKIFGEGFVAQVPQAELTLIPGAGHMLQITQPEKTAAWITSRAALSR
ncbi:MAG TPA: alpha/beta hydrolase [Candidatus Acidoferrales bacterium]|nr:alpha/beta hydrolase [Candidatus Acidoferrales bacterium]